MVRSKKTSVPTSAEFELLKVLWRTGPSTVRQVHEQVSASSGSAYTTTLKMLQIMFEKGFVTRDESNKAHVYSPRYSEAQTQNSLIRDMVGKAFGGSRFNLVMRALGESASKQEIDEIRSLLDSIERNRQ